MDIVEPNISSHLMKEDTQCKIQTSSRVDCEFEWEAERSEASSFEKSKKVNESISVCESPDASSVDKSQVGSNGENCQSSQALSVSKYEMDIHGEPKSQVLDVASTDVEEDGFSKKDEQDSYVVPKVGVEFEFEDQAYKCYSRYAVLEGFSIRKDFVNKSRINGEVVSRRYTCYRQGYRPTKHNVKVRKARQETRTGCMAHMTIARQPNGKFRVTHFETKHNHEFVTQCTVHMLPSQKRLTFAEAVETVSGASSEMDRVPKLGLGFDSEDHAYEFYNSYAGRVGFSVRKDYVNKSKIDGAVASRRFTCFREGFRQKDKRDLTVKRPRRETRIGCLAQLVISRQTDRKYRVTHFVEKHNHELVAPCRVHMLRSQKRSAIIQDVEGDAQGGSNTQLRSASGLSSDSAKDWVGLGYNPIDHKSRLSSKRTREMKEGEAGKLQQYFHTKQAKNASFFFSMQLDGENQLTNIFWADEKMVVDYSDFGDVVCFDTTYRLSKECRPFSIFLGINHYKQMVIFGAALMYDETVDSFKWLFQTFLDVMSGKKPKTFLTGQDAILAEAANLVFPESNHRVCVWHVYQHVLKQLSDMVADSSFINDLSRLLFDTEDKDDFNHEWKLLLDVYGLWENVCLSEIFHSREKWAIPYGRHIFCADITSAQLCEGLISSWKKHLKLECDVISFLKHFGKMMTDMHYKELEANYNMTQHTPRLMGDIILLKHAMNIYTPKVFELFQEEYETSLNIIVNQCSENATLAEYKVSLYEQPQEYTLTYYLSDESVVCECMKFEFMGVLCSHALKVLDYRNIKMLPGSYILKRWTKDARVCIF